jgi:hypothetical protein
MSANPLSEHACKLAFLCAAHIKRKFKSRTVHAAGNHVGSFSLQNWGGARPRVILPAITMCLKMESDAKGYYPLQFKIAFRQ